MLPTITLEGRLVADPDLKFTASGQAVANMRVACSESKKRDDGTWEDGDKLFVSVALWKESAEAAADAVGKGDKVVVTGRLYQREYETSGGEKRTSLEVKFATLAKVVEAPRGERTGGSSTPSARTSPSASTPAPSDPWATLGSTDEPPF